MKIEDIARMAKEAGFHAPGHSVQSPYIGGSDMTPLLERFAHLVAAAERDECAKILERTDLSQIAKAPDMQKWIAEFLLAFATTIRARGAK
jgi:hypothetical protein